MVELFFKMATIFFYLTNRQKTQQAETVQTGFSSKILKVRKLFSHKIVCIFRSVLIVCVLLKAVKA